MYMYVASSQYSSQVCEEMQLIIDHILSLMSVRSNNYLIEGFDLTEINDDLTSYNHLRYNVRVFALFYVSISVSIIILCMS